MSKDLPVIYHARTIEEADVLVGWLEERGIAAIVKNRNAAATLPVPAIVAPEGIEVCALEADQVAEARRLLQDHFDATETARDDLPPIDVECEECNRVAAYPGTVRGRVENCPHCDAYVDVPE